MILVRRSRQFASATPMTLYMCLGQTLSCESKGRYLISVNEPKAGIYSDGQDLFAPLTGSGSYVLAGLLILKGRVQLQHLYHRPDLL